MHVIRFVFSFKVFNSRLCIWAIQKSQSKTFGPTLELREVREVPGSFRNEVCSDVPRCARDWKSTLRRIENSWLFVASIVNRVFPDRPTVLSDIIRKLGQTHWSFARHEWKWKLSVWTSFSNPREALGKMPKCHWSWRRSKAVMVNWWQNCFVDSPKMVC
jgi:hypothetical protein